MHILVIEDMAEYASAIQTYLGKLKHSVVVEPEPDRAIGILEGQSFDGIICAAYFESKDPMDFLACINKHPKFSELPFLMYAQAETDSGHRFLKTVGQAALQLGADDFLALDHFNEKPICEKLIALLKGAKSSE